MVVVVVVEIVVVEIVVVETEVAVVAAGVDAHVLDVAAVGPIAVVVHDPVAVVGAGHVADDPSVCFFTLFSPIEGDIFLQHFT